MSSNEVRPAHRTKDLVRAFLLEVRSGAHPERAGQSLAERVRAHQLEAEALRTIERTARQYADHVAEIARAYGRFEFTVDELLADGDRVHARWTHRGRPLAPIQGRPPTGRPVTEIASAAYRVEAGRIVEHWIQIDRQDIRAQVEALTARLNVTAVSSARNDVGVVPEMSGGNR